MQASGGRSPVSAPTRSLHSSSTPPRSKRMHTYAGRSTRRACKTDGAMLRPMPGLQVPCVRALVVVVARRRPGKYSHAYVVARSSFRRGHSNVVRACPHLQKATHARGDNETPSHGRESLDRRNCQGSWGSLSCGATLVADSRRDGRNRSNTRKRSRNPARKERRPGRGPKAWEGGSGVEWSRGRLRRGRGGYSRPPSVAMASGDDGIGEVKEGERERVGLRCKQAGGWVHRLGGYMPCPSLGPVACGFFAPVQSQSVHECDALCLRWESLSFYLLVPTLNA